MNRSNIGWTDLSGGDLNFVIGCTPISPACTNCYARVMLERYGRDFSQVHWYPEKLQRLRFFNWGRLLLDVQQGRTAPWRRGTKVKPMAFVVDLGDLFHVDVPAEFIFEALALMSDIECVDWQILTKRPLRMRNLVTEMFGEQGAPPNMWLGVTAENQAMANQRIPLLLRTPAAVRFVSIEPMLEKMTLTALPQESGDVINGLYGWHEAHTLKRVNGLDWVIVGGESGSNRRPFDPLWAEALYDECSAAGVAFFGKQGSALQPGSELLIRGQTVKEFPERKMQS